MYDDYFKSHEIGFQEPPTIDNWKGIKLAIAESIWSEFFANTIASKYFEEDSDSFISLGIDILQGSLLRIQQQIKIFRINNNIVDLWNLTTDELSGLFNQFGRSIGILVGNQYENNKTAAFMRNIAVISQKWLRISKNLINELKILLKKDKLDMYCFTNLENIIEQGFHTFGIYPQYNNSKLTIRVL